MVCDIKNKKLEISKSRPEPDKSGLDPSLSFQILGPEPEPEFSNFRARAREVRPETETKFSNFRTQVFKFEGAVQKRVQ